MIENDPSARAKSLSNLGPEFVPPVLEDVLKRYEWSRLKSIRLDEPSIGRDAEKVRYLFPNVGSKYALLATGQ